MATKFWSSLTFLWARKHLCPQRWEQTTHAVAGNTPGGAGQAQESFAAASGLGRAQAPSPYITPAMGTRVTHYNNTSLECCCHGDGLGQYIITYLPSMMYHCKRGSCHKDHGGSLVFWLKLHPSPKDKKSGSSGFTEETQGRGWPLSLEPLSWVICSMLSLVLFPGGPVLLGRGMGSASDLPVPSCRDCITQRKLLLSCSPGSQTCWLHWWCPGLWQMRQMDPKKSSQS